MHFADRPNRFDEPGSCIVIPGRVADENGGVMLDGVYDGARGDLRLWLSYAGLHKIVTQFGRKLNVATYEQFEEAADRAVRFEAEAQQLRAERDELQAKLDRISGLRKDGFQISRVQGRPKTKATS